MGCLLICVTIFRLAMDLNLLILGIVSLCLAVLVMTVVVSGRLEVCLILVIVVRRWLLLLLAMGTMLARVGMLCARALAPLRTTARNPRVALKVLVEWTRTLRVVFPLALMATDTGAVSFRV